MAIVVVTDSQSGFASKDAIRRAGTTNPQAIQRLLADLWVSISTIRSWYVDIRHNHGAIRLLSHPAGRVR
ncbi:hypothetical protein PkoCFBP13504_04740 [Pseudomonas koreensis]|nr:hypothetical protein PkoCFBP13504_04740 [Pseudomonas koreensis]